MSCVKISKCSFGLGNVPDCFLESGRHFQATGSRFLYKLNKREITISEI